MHLLIAISNRDCTKLVNTLQTYLPDVEISLWPHCRNLHTVEFVVAWLAPEQMWQQLPNLKAVSSFGAGVDSINLDLLADDVVLAAGVYRMHFATQPYFAANNETGFYPYVDIVFELDDASHNSDSHYHIPLLLTAFGYSTYRGS